LLGLIEAGKLTPVNDKTYPLEEAADAMRYLETGRVRGKVMISVGEYIGDTGSMISSPAG